MSPLFGKSSSPFRIIKKKTINCIPFNFFFLLFVYIGLCIPSNNTIFIKAVSEKLATNEPHLTLEFLEECIQGFQRSTIELKHLCLEYMTPWLKNLVKFCKSSDESKKLKVSQILECLINLTIQQREMYPSIQAKIWGSIGQVFSEIFVLL